MAIETIEVNAVFIFRSKFLENEMLSISLSAVMLVNTVELPIFPTIFGGGEREMKLLLYLSKKN